MKYYKNTDNKTFVDPILANHTGLVEITKTEFLAIANPPKTPEQLIDDMIKEGEHIVIAHIQEPITAYNETHGVSFGGPHSCANYKDHPTYSHALFCTDIWNFNVTVWESARASLIVILQAGEPYPTDEEFKAMLPTYIGVV